MAAESKHDRIVRSALAAFCRKGFHEATMEDIALGAGVGKGTLYLYFPGKQALLEAVLRDGLEAYSSGLQRIAAGPGRPSRRLEAMAVFALEFAAGNREIAQLAQEGPVGKREEFRRWLWALQSRILATVREVAAEGVRAGEFRALDPFLLAHVFLGSVHSLAAAVIGEGSLPLPPPVAARDLVALILARAEPASAGEGE